MVLCVLFPLSGPTSLPKGLQITLQDPIQGSVLGPSLQLGWRPLEVLCPLGPLLEMLAPCKMGPHIYLCTHLREHLQEQVARVIEQEKV